MEENTTPRREKNFDIRYEEDGVYINVTDSAKPVDEMYIVFYIKHTNIINPDLRSALLALRNRETRVRLAPPQQEKNYGEGLFVFITQDEMAAYAELVEPSSQSEPKLSAPGMSHILLDDGIRAGVDHGVLEQMAQERAYGARYKVAAGTPVKNGENASLEYLFKRTFDGKAKTVEGTKDRVDFRELDLFENVKAGAALVRRTPATPGTDGVTVRGRVVKAKPGRELSLPRGRNVNISEDGLTLTAGMDGRVSYIDSKVSVETVYTVDGDVDMSTGNITFSGDVVVRGGVIAGMAVKASGNIEVHGMVEAATLDSAGDIILHSGIQGADKGELRSGGNIRARFVERAKLSAKQNVYAEAVMHSTIQSGADIHVLGRRGSIIGGILRAEHSVAARVIGSPKNVRTQLEVGIAPDNQVKGQELQDERKKLLAEMARIDQLHKTLGNVAIPGEPPERGDLRKKVKMLRTAIPQRLEQIDAQIAELVDVIKNSTNGRVHVKECVYPGTYMSIGNAVYTVKQDIEFATFSNVGGEVRYLSCEFTG